MKKSYNILKSDIGYVKKNRVGMRNEEWLVGEGMVILNWEVREGLVERWYRDQSGELRLWRSGSVQEQNVLLTALLHALFLPSARSLGSSKKQEVFG